MTVDEARDMMCCIKKGCGCCGSYCMAWRWNDLEVKNEGYCGLAGREGAE